ncbi:cytochrome P450 [Streptomyces sp. NBC_01619]|uniref:cytochrome P450 n=1 Tax=Streptomyces sp. NBC_01619 TaxID=2975901 RepID=UPI0022535C4D|nr:cytochrome P450 [Streptomyces sp. NBC_01619]MCX4515790.1 cytochrome P450 [Streptomyces sp. NBC_01619]
MSTGTNPAVPPPGCPAHGSGQRLQMYTPDFAANPQACYDYLRQLGPTAPVELAPGVKATLVTSHHAALQLLQNPSIFRKDARRWRDFNDGKISPDSPVLPLLSHRFNCMFSDGADHRRLRQAVTDSFAQVDPRWLSQSTERASQYLIHQFSAHGSADLLSDYAKQLPLIVFNGLFGCPEDIGDRVLFGVSGIFDGINAEEANDVLLAAVTELVALKRARPGEDVTSWLLQHQARLSDQEMAHQLALLLGAGAEPLSNLIANTLYLLLVDDRFLHSAMIDEAIDATLWSNPPISNYAPHYPVTNVEFAGQELSAGDLVLISFAAANSDPTPGHTAHNRAHLAWSAGPHACPSKEPARLITVTAIETLFNHLPDITLAVPQDSLTWRPGPFHRALTNLPATFTHRPRATQPSEQHLVQTPTVNNRTVPENEPERSGVWSKFLAWWTKT